MPSPLRHATGAYRHMEIGTPQAKNIEIGTIKGECLKSQNVPETCLSISRMAYALNSALDVP